MVTMHSTETHVSEWMQQANFRWSEDVSLQYIVPMTIYEYGIALIPIQEAIQYFLKVSKRSSWTLQNVTIFGTPYHA